MDLCREICLVDTRTRRPDFAAQLPRVLYNFARSDPAFLEGGNRLGMDEHDSLQFGNTQSGSRFLYRRVFFLLPQKGYRKARLPWPDFPAGAAISKRKLLTNRRIQGTIINVSQEPIIRLALRLWAANRLLMKGWEICGHEHLGMDIVGRLESPLYGSIPVPRVLQNQLDHLLEAEIVKTERYLLKNLQKVIRASNRSAWVITFLGIAIILHVMERDAWRLLYWVNQEQVSSFN